MATLNNSLGCDEAIIINRLVCQDLIGQIFDDHELLTPKQCEVLSKLFVEGKNVIRIAKENNVSPQSVNDLKIKTLEKIRRKYQDLEKEYI